MPVSDKGPVPAGSADIARHPESVARSAAFDVSPGPSPATVLPDPAPTGAVSAMPPAAGPAPGAPPVAPADLPSRLGALVEDIQIRTRDGTSTAPHRTEIELAPATLGRIRVTLETGDRGLHLAVQTDRPETVELVRRQLEVLHRNLVADGVPVDRVELSSGSRGQVAESGADQFGSSDGGARGDRAAAQTSQADRNGRSADGDPPAPDIRDGQARSATGTGRLDLRL
ncbi:MAG: flagellar hook-length control protein FliK [Pseudomonadota bacterium]